MVANRVEQQCLDLETRVGLCVRKGHMFSARYHYENFYLGPVPRRWQLSSELKEKEEDARTRGVRDGEKKEEDLSTHTSEVVSSHAPAYPSVYTREIPHPLREGWYLGGWQLAGIYLLGDFVLMPVLSSRGSSSSWVRATIRISD